MTGESNGMSDKTVFEQQCAMLIKDAGKENEAERLHKLFKVAWEHQMAEYPEWATRIGHPGYNDRWTDHSLEAIERRKRELQLQLKVMESIDTAKLDAADQLNYDLFKNKITDDIEGARFKREFMPISQLDGIQQDIAQLLSMMPVNTIAQCEDILARLDGVPTVVDQTIALLNEGLKAGVTPPRITLRNLPHQVKNQIADNPPKAPMLAALTNLPSTIPSTEQERIRNEAYSIYTQKVVPAFEKLHAYLVEVYLPACRETIALSDLPDGKDWYAYLVRRYTTTDLTPKEIFSIGLSEVKRILQEMDKVIEETGFKGDFAAFCEFLRTYPQFYFDDAEDLLQTYRDIAKRADPELIKLFGRLPRLPYGVIAIPAYAEKSQTTAYYDPGSLEAGRPGYFYANTYDLKSRPKWEMEALTLHEAVPGHHLQISLAQELEGLPEFRKQGWYTAYGEGWALYSESLGEVMGFYKDPYSKFGQLTYEMWRAIRLVVDVGIHTMGWNRQRAIDFFKENSSKTEHDIEVEVDRYIVWPAQALAYKIGELKIKELRAFAAKELGEQFDIRAFHDEILGHGALPLDILEARIKVWVTEQKQK